MIKGIHVDVPAKELQKHLRERAEHHDSRAEFYRHKSEGWDGDLDQFTGNPRQALEQKVENHEHKATYFRVIAAYLIEGEVYRLKQSDLRSLDYKEWEV